MAQARSSHLSDIPQAVRIAASVSAVDPQLKQQAIDYLAKVKDLCEETWQDCLELYVQGAGAGPSTGNKLDTELRLFCEQVVDAALTKRAASISPEAYQATYKTLANFVQVEYVEGPCEGGQSYLRNKLAFTLAHLFLDVYPTLIPTFLHPFIALLKASNRHPALLTIHLLAEIAQEIHDSTLKSARPHDPRRQERDGQMRDVIRTSGDERLVVDGLLGLAEEGLRLDGWVDVVEQALRTFSTWTPWVDLAVTLTPKTLDFYHRLLGQTLPVAIQAAAVLRTLVGKGVQDSNDRLQILKVIDVPTIIERVWKDDLEFCSALGSLLSAYGSELVEFIEREDVPTELHSEAEGMMIAALPLLLRFLSDRRAEVPLSVAPFVSDVLRLWKKLYAPPKALPTHVQKMPPPPAPVLPLPAERRSFLASLLDVSMRQLAWPDDAEWEAPTDEPDPDDELATLRLMRVTIRAHIESIAAIDRDLHTEVVANIIASTLESLKTTSWQHAELAMHLVYTFGELTKSNTRAAFYELPAEVASKTNRKQREVSMSGRTTPTSENGEVESSEKVDYTRFPLSPLGQLLTLCMSSGIANYPHPGVLLQYFEIAVRYVEFWKSRPGAVRPLLEALLDQRGIHNPDENVRRRCFYLFTKFVKDARNDIDLDMIPPILDSFRDLRAINAELPTVEGEEDVLLKATTGKTYFADQLYLFEASGVLVWLTRADARRQLLLLESVAGPLMAGMGTGGSNPQAVLSVHHHLMALGNFAKGFPAASDAQLEHLPYQAPFKQMTAALLQALRALKTQRIVRDAARLAFSQFVSAIGTAIAELVPQFVEAVVAEFEPSELVDFMMFLNLLMHRLKNNTFETMDMLLLPLLSRIFAVLQSPVDGTDDLQIHDRLKSTYLTLFTSMMNANLDGVFITDRNKPEFENVLQGIMALAQQHDDAKSQRLAFAFFAKSVIAWGTSPDAAVNSVFAESAMSELSKAVANGTAHASNQHAIPKEQRAAQALPGYENFIYQRLLPLCFEVPAHPKFMIMGQGSTVVIEIAMLLRNTLQARGQEAIDYLLTNLLPKLNCPQAVAEKLVHDLRTQQSRDFRKTFSDFIKAMKA